MSQQLLSMIVGCSKPIKSKCCLTAWTFVVWSSYRLFAMPDSTSILPAASCWDSELWLISFVILCSVESGLWPFSTVCAVVATVFCCSLTAGCPIGKPASSVSYCLHGYPLLWGSPALPSYHRRTSMWRRNKQITYGASFSFFLCNFFCGHFSLTTKLHSAIFLLPVGSSRLLLSFFVFSPRIN